MSRLRSPFRRKRLWIAVAVAAVRRADALIARADAGADQRRKVAVQQASDVRDEAVEAAARTWQHALAQLSLAIAAATAELDGYSPPAGADWSGWRPVGHPVEGLRLGTHLLAGADGERIGVPALFPFPATTNLVVRASRGNAAHADAVLGLVSRMLACVPPGQLRLSVVDPLSLGRSVRSLAGLNSDDVRLMDDPLIDPRAVEDKLGELIGRISRVDRDLLGPHRLTSLVEYNHRSNARPEPYHVLIIFDFPRGFTTPDSLTRLDQVMTNGPHCGIYTVLVLTGDSEDHPHHLALDAGGRASTGPAAFAPPAVGAWDLELERPPEPTWEASAQLRTIVERVADLARDANRVVVTLDWLLSLVPPGARPEVGGIPGVTRTVRVGDPGTWWQADAAAGLVIPLGTYSLDDVLPMWLGEGGRHHVMVAGMTGSGKSTLLHTMISAAAVLYSPKELELYLIDLKQGVEFAEYATRSLPHARVVSIHSDREFGLEALNRLLTEIDTRAALFKKYAVVSLAAYRRARALAVYQAEDEQTAAGVEADPLLARILLVIDEYHVLFDTDDDIARRATECLETLTRMGRAYGIHVLLASQTPSSPVRMGDSMRQMAVRIALRCDDQTSRRILAENNPAATELRPQGEAIYNPSFGQVGRDSRFQVAFHDESLRVATLDALRDRARDLPSNRVPQVYDGYRPGDITRDGEFTRLATAGAGAGGGSAASPSRALRLWLGEPMGLAGPVSVELAARAQRGLLVIGEDDENVGVIVAVLTSLAAAGVGRGGPPGADTVSDAVSVVDFTPPDHRYPTVHDELTVLLPGLRHLGGGAHLAHLEELAELAETRAADDDLTVDLVADSRVVILHGLHRARGIAQAPGAWKASGLAVPLGTLLQQGSDAGIFVIATLPAAGVRRVSREILNEFGVVLTHRYGESFDERINALAGRRTARLRAGQALLVDDGTPTRLRPYTIPPPGWLKDFARTLGDRDRLREHVIIDGDDRFP
ncbi:Cell divisionFtsK/SpoIIIE (modular protein) [Frankia canadensis]|uniref:Cell divisionFtsK/SpoIIIE (Modular protein) n=1 Tax=Frankia canadensis TaxID=1836972 RepID=A0A2I2KNB0_9ACTN|nr:Cell divisionFtsK/SpoIIIE (modular protein) [Frankia canadensis]SOU54443.1 Cell divisionFtsK/SpoIIIE (modular protein) [Frankia canadensis]